MLVPALERSRAADHAAAGVAPRPKQRVRELAERTVSGGHSGGETPVPIPNTAVKPARANGITGGGPPGRVGRCRDFLYEIPFELRLEGISSFLGPILAARISPS